VSQGRTNKEIGVILHLSPRTVQKHLEHVYRKLNVTTRTAAAGKLYNLFQHSGKQMSIFFFFSISSLMM
jgi:DNA-binding CsgD family transcriptional regulator